MLVVNLQKWPKNGTEADEMASLFWHALDSIAPVITLNHLGGIAYANRRFCQVSGYVIEEIPDFFNQLVCFEYHSEGFDAELQTHLQSNQIWIKSIFIKHKNGIPVEYEVSFIPKKVPSHDFEKFLVLTPTGNKTGDEDSDKTDQDDRLQGTEQDFCNTLKAANLLCKTLQGSVLNEHQREIVKKIEESLCTLAHSVGEHSKRNKKELLQEQPAPEPFDLGQTLQSLIARYRDSAAHSGIHILTQFELPATRKITGVKTFLEQILAQPLDFLLGRRETQMINLSAISNSVSDNNCEVSFFIMGLLGDQKSEAEQDKIGNSAHEFEFERLNSILLKAGGKLLLQQVTGKSFYLHFLMSFPFSQPVSGINSNVQTNGKEVFPEKTLILIAEDDELNQMVIKQHLLKMGLTLHFVRTGFNVLEKLKTQQYDLIIMDNQMPGLDGEQTIKAIRADQEAVYSEIPIIGISANSSKQVRNACLQAGANDFVPKPYEPLELKEKMVPLVVAYRSKLFKHHGHITKQEYLPTMENYFDLTYLDETSEGDKEFSSTMISFFVENTPAVLENLKNKVKLEDWEAVRQIAHKLKPQVIYMGIHIIKDDVEKMEDYANHKINLEEIPVLGSRVEKYCFLAIEQLKEELKKYEMS
ncbi:MAG TPA: response regulator [Bacteroidales bacterium]|nr:response regulator [Bacteroidales bacterium]